jgi:ATP-dependent Clp protease adaptor protein ClpS
MAEQDDKGKGKDDKAGAGNTGSTGGSTGGSTAVAEPKQKNKPKPNPPKHLPGWKVLLHNDDKNEMIFVVRTIMELTTLNHQDAVERTIEAHESGVALLLRTHKERAELYKEQFESKGLTATIEPEEE